MRPASRRVQAPNALGQLEEHPSFEENVVKILGAARSHNTNNTQHQILVIHVHHHSTSPTSALHPSHFLPGSSTPSVAPLPFAAPKGSEPVFTKNQNSSFVGTKLEEMLRSAGIGQLVVVGLTTDHCVSTTVRMAANLQVLGDEGGPDGNGEGVHGVVVVRDAVATYEKGAFDAETVHAVNLASLDGEFADIANTQDVMATVFDA